MITLEVLLTSRPASTAASSEPGSEISSMMGSGDDVSDKLVICMSGPLAEDLGAATQPTLKHNTTYCDAIERSGHAQCLWAAAH